MLAFLLLASRNGMPIEPQVIDIAARRSTAYLPFAFEASLRWSNRSGTVAVLAWQGATENAGLVSHWHVGADGGLTLFGGHCWPRATGWSHDGTRSWADQLAGWLDRHPVAEAHEELFGFYSLVRLDAEGDGMVTTDLLGAGQLFTGEGERWVTVSNRAGLAAAGAVGFEVEPERDPLAMGWLAFWDSSLGDDCGYWDATRVPFNGEVHIGSNGTASVVIRPRPFWHRLGPDPTHASYDELLDEVEADLRAVMRVIARLPEEDFELRLSGGKDSRLLTALLYDEGLHEQVRFMTHGLPGHADARAAALVAEQLGLRWRLENRGEVPLDEEERKLLRHTFLVEGVTSGWDSAGIATAQRGVSLSGIGGECTTFGPTSRASLAMTKIEEVKQLYAEKDNFDPTRVLIPEVHAHCHRVVAEWVDREAAAGQEVNRIASLFITQQRTRTWSGPSRAVKASLWLGPFLIPSYIRFRQLLPVDERATPRVHLDLLRRCKGELWLVPLANDAWAEGAIVHWPDADRLRAIEPMRSLPGGSQGWRTARFPELKPMFHTYLDERSNPLYEIVDYAGVQNLLARKKVTGQQLRILYGLATGAIWLGHRETPVAANRAWDG